PSSGDGAGLLMQVPDAFFREVLDFALPEPAPDGAPAYAVGCAFLPDDDARAAAAVALTERIAAEEGLAVLGWREVPTDAGPVGPTARSVMPRFRQLFLGARQPGGTETAPAPGGGSVAAAAGGKSGAATAAGGMSDTALELRAFCVRKRAQHETRAAGCGTYFPSLSARTLVYKGMLTTG